ncbi:lysis protein [Providencia rettgeri]|uniref:lysis protein n=1 Tax=Providencia TaxID=586 RepID=UPI000807C415|nr:MULTISPECIES: lysis protein [unclassified Providencia]ELR5064807.1 lysis protein [Providencia rettgeri]ELR5164985.1 lysis protein [Providencia rettgeri]ELR5287155.1 lysis protein [Providencia rettgeri]OBY34609.1 lysozyme [Providencia rettgeri]QIF58554.1 lysis protein [Providencia sp. 1701011]
MNSLKSWLPVLLWGGLCIALFFSTKEMIELGKENKGLKKANSSLVAEIADYEKRINSLHELDTKHTTELTNAKAEIDQLRIAAERNPERVYIRASCPKGETNSTSGMDDEATARPTDSAIGNYWLLRQRIAESKQMILGLQDYIRTECLR